METRHREEGENLAHCLVSSGGGWTQGFLPAAPDRGAPPPVNSPVESSQYSLCMHKCTCNVTRCSGFCLLHRLLGVFIARSLPIVQYGRKWRLDLAIFAFRAGLRI